MITGEEIEKMRLESVARRKAHPEWPSHKPSVTFPGGGTLISENMPIGKAKVRGYCKYCYTTHANWWAMDSRESDPERDGPLLLCGHCEHTSLQQFIAAVPDYAQAKVTKELIATIIRRHTSFGTKHQKISLEMLDVDYERWDAEVKAITCKRCKDTLEDCVRWTKDGAIVDSWGYTEFDDGNLCYRCDKQGFVGDIIMPKKAGTA